MKRRPSATPGVKTFCRPRPAVCERVPATSDEGELSKRPGAAPTTRTVTATTPMGASPERVSI